MRHFHLFSHTARAALFLMAGFMAGCRDVVESGDPRACQQTYEFGNNGCVEVVGQVIGLRGQALPNVVIFASPVTESVVFVFPDQRTDSAGSFRIRGARMVGGRPAGAALDTLSVFVTAAGVRTAGVVTPTIVRDSVLIVATVAPVGTIPEPASTRITLQVP